MERLEERRVLAGFGPEDGAFVVESWNGLYKDVVIQPSDQKILAAGSQGQALAVARYDSLGNPDAAYGAGGLATPPPGGQSTGGITLQPDGKAVVSTTQAGYLGAGRFNTNGSLDTTFSYDGWTSVNARSGHLQFGQGIGRQSTGEIVVAGFTMQSGSGTQGAILGGFKANGAVNSGKGGFGQIGQGGKASGSTLSTFGTDYATFNDLAIQSDNKIVAVGQFRLPGAGYRQLLVARYTAKGMLDTTFNSTGYSVLTLPGNSYTVNGEAGVALQTDGKIVTTSSITGMDGSGDMLVARYTASGILDTTFGGGAGYVRLDIDGLASVTHESGQRVTIQPDGKIVAVGSHAGQAGPFNVLVARFNPNGTPDETFAAGGFKLGVSLPGAGFHSFLAEKSVAIKADGSIIVVGSVYQDSSLNQAYQHPFVMRFYGTTPAAMAATSGAMVPLGVGAASDSSTTKLSSSSERERIELNTSSPSASSGSTATSGRSVTNNSLPSRATWQRTSGARVADDYFAQLGDPLSEPVADPLSLSF